MTAKIEKILDGFTESMSGLLIKEYQSRLAELDLTLLQAQLLRVLRRGGQLPTGQLAAELGLSPSAVTGLLDRLLRKNLIERQAAARDRRAVMVALTDEGRTLVDQFRHRRGRIIISALRSLGAEEQAEVVRALEKMQVALESHQRGRRSPKESV